MNEMNEAVEKLKVKFKKRKREHVIDLVSYEQMGPSWKEIVGKRDLTEAAYCAFGPAEEIICLMRFGDGSYEVGQGECVRPYIPHYKGPNFGLAQQEFENAIENCL